MDNLKNEYFLIRLKNKKDLFFIRLGFHEYSFKPYCLEVFLEKYPIALELVKQLKRKYKKNIEVELYPMNEFIRDRSLKTEK